VVSVSGKAFSVSDLDGGIEYINDALYVKEIDIQSNGGFEYWYPVVQPGLFYYAGDPYRIFENPQYTHINITSGSAELPSGVLRHYKTILASSGSYPSDLSSFIFKDHTYKWRYKNIEDVIATGIVEDNITYRKRSYLTADMGLNLTLGSGEYNINYDDTPPTIYASGVDDCVFIWDQIDVPSGRICDTQFSDLNPLNDNSISFNNYFLVIGV